MTKNSRLIFDIVKSSRSHPTAKDIFDQMKKISPGTVMATVYNNLAHLSEAGLIRKIEIPNEADRYDRAEISHEHMICEKCGSVCDIMMEDLTNIISEKAGEDITSYSLIVKYICSDCRNASEVKN